MSDPSTKDDDLPDNPQQLIGFMKNEEWDQLLSQVNEMIEEMEALPLLEVKDKVFELLAGIDAIHREGLIRLVRLFKKGVLEQVVSDPPIHTLMEMYDLLPPGTEFVDEPEPETELSFANIPIQVNAAAAKKPASRQKFPHWIPVLKNIDDLAPGSVREMDVDGELLLMCRVKDEIFAMQSRCAQDGSPLAGATLSSYTLGCPNHGGCLYDVRQGTRIAGPGEIECYPVRTSDDKVVSVGMDMTFVPKLPAF